MTDTPTVNTTTPDTPISKEIQAALEAIIYAADEPATLDQIAHALGVEKSIARSALDLLVAAYSVEDRGIEVRKVAGGWKFYTKPQHHDAVRKFIKSLQPPLRLTMPALETLAVIAYRQPATVPEINEIRGVNVGGVIKTLLEKRLITTAGRKEVIGRPILYRTSKQFLMRFGLSDLEELPSLKEFEQLAQAALGSDAGIAPIEPESTDVAPEASFDGSPIGREAASAAASPIGSEVSAVASAAASVPTFAPASVDAGPGGIPEGAPLSEPFAEPGDMTAADSAAADQVRALDASASLDVSASLLDAQSDSLIDSESDNDLAELGEDPLDPEDPAESLRHSRAASAGHSEKK